MQMPRLMRTSTAATFRVHCSSLQSLAALIKVLLWYCRV